jgi:hypothetical protein
MHIKGQRVDGQGGAEPLRQFLYFDHRLAPLRDAQRYQVHTVGADRAIGENPVGVATLLRARVGDEGGQREVG